MRLCKLHDSVARATATLRHGPVDELLRRLDGASLAVHAVLRVDDEVALAGSVGFSVLINTCRAKSLLRASIFLDRDLRRDAAELGLDSQVRRLVVVVVGARPLQVGEQVEGDFAIWLWVINWFALCCLFSLVGVLDLVVEGPRLAALRDPRRKGGVHHASSQPCSESSMRVADFVQLFVYP